LRAAAALRSSALAGRRVCSPSAAEGMLSAILLCLGM
jgi:hypothetical protein